MCFHSGKCCRNYRLQGRGHLGSEHYSDVIMGAMTSQITRLFTQPFIQAQIRKYQSSASLAFLRGIHPWPVNSSHKWPVTRKMFPFDDVIMDKLIHWGLVMRIWASELGQHWFGQWLPLVRNTVIAWIITELSVAQTWIKHNFAFKKTHVKMPPKGCRFV